MITKKHLILLPVLILLATNCSTKYIGRAYEGPELPASEVGVVVFNHLSNSSFYQRIVPCKVDGQKVKMYQESNSLHVLPGKHTLMWIYDSPGPLITAESTIHITAGHRYLFTFSEANTIPPDRLLLEIATYGIYKAGPNVSIWLEDSTIGQRVMEITSVPKSIFSCM
jgi:hypothetical protein